MKYDAITRAGIEVVERVNIPEHMIPADAQVEMDAKMAAGYFTPGAVPNGRRAEEVAKGRAPGHLMPAEPCRHDLGAYQNR